MRQGKRAPARWDTEFGRWVASYGIGRIVAELEPYPALHVTRKAIEHWIAGRRAPTPARAFALIELSRGALTIEMIYRHWRIRQVRDQERRPCRST